MNADLGGAIPACARGGTTAALLALILAVSAPFSQAQDAGTPAPPAAAESSATATPAESSAPAAAPSEAAKEKPPPTAEELVSGSLARDISTASYYELVTWCDQLGLDDSGSRKELQARLASHFKVTLPEAAAPGRREVTVRSARQSEYFTQKESGEKYVLLRGDVVVEVRDAKDDTLQVIKAASLTFNQTRRTMSAVGNVTYTLTRGGQTDTFTGESLDFNLDSSEAVFYGGSTRRVIKRSGAEVPYTFSGETITRVSNETVVLQKGAFTSSDTPADPLYQIRAGTVWLLAPGEWAVQNAVLMIGRVPILYLPGFFWPGDDFFFNPNIGYKAREGSFVQTTTYLVGRKQTQESPFSFLQLSGSGDAGYALEPRGLFLRKIPGSTPPKESGHTLKLMVDFYQRLGAIPVLPAMVGLAGDFSPLATFRTSLGLSRSVFLDSTTNLYTPYLPVAIPPYSAGQEFWNSSSLFGISVPVRFGLEGTLKASSPMASLSTNFQLFSDPYFTSDFYTRSESGMLSALFTQPGTTQTSTAQQTNLSWDLTGNLDFTKLVNLPFVKTLSISNFNLKMTWQSNTPTGLSDPQASDPGRAFYYPSSITAPNVSVAMSGDILSLGSETPAPSAPLAPSGGAAVTPPAPASTPASTAGPASAAAPAAPAGKPPSQDPGKGFRPPVSAVEAPSAPKEPPPRIPFRSPDAQPSIAQQPSGQSTFKVSYQVQPRATLEHTFDTTNAASWRTRQDVTYAFLYRSLETGGTSSVTAAASFLDKLADTSVTLSADGLWRYRFDPLASYQGTSAWTQLLTTDQQQDRLAFRTAFQGTVRPFPAITELSTSSLQYRINARMYQIGLTPNLLDPYNPSVITFGPAWSSDAISEHSLASTLALSSPATNDSLALTFQLPPLVPTMTGRLDAAGGVFRARAQGGFSAPQTGLVYQPLVVSAGVDFGQGAAGSSAAGSTAAGTTTTSNAFTASEELQFDLAGALVSRATTQVGVWGLSGTFVAQNSGIPNDLAPATVRVGYEAATDPLWYWKDRVKLVLGLKTHWYLNLQNKIDNLLDFSPSVTLTVYKNLDLTFSSTSSNTRSYLYFPALSGLPAVNPLVDLAQSFNFFNNDDRRRSGFKIQAFSLKAVQHFPDWDLSVQYQGSPQLITHTYTTGPQVGQQYQQYEWSPTFSIQVQWKAVSEVKSTIHQEAPTGSTGTYNGPAYPSLR